VQLLKLRVFQYRNFTQQEIQFSPGVNLLVGGNGQGKTNLLEAVYFLGYGKSFRTAIPRECIQHGHNQCRIGGTIGEGEIVRELHVAISPSEKKLFISGKAAFLDEFAGNLHVLAFTNEHLAIVRGGPKERRAFLDRAMITLFPGHLRLLASFGRAVKQRNRMLSAARASGKEIDSRLVDSWDEALIQEGSRIAWNRSRYVDELKKELPAGLFGAEEIKIHYLSTLPDLNEGLPAIADKYRERLLQARSADEKSGFTSVGPHRDDLKLFMNGKTLADFGSAGQQRSCLLSLFFSQMEIHRKHHGFYPVFLVDDAEAELDEKRLRTFLDYLAERTQTFLTTAKESFLPRIAGKTSRFLIQAGSVICS
jgi:DNA replication and repair protein RecF